MAEKEMYDYLSSASPDNDQTLNVSPQDVLVESSSKRGEIHIGDDGSEERVAFSTASIFYVTLTWDKITTSDLGTIFDFYNDSAKGNGEFESFKWVHPSDGHTYVVRFDGELDREWRAVGRHGTRQVRLRVLGYV